MKSAAISDENRLSAASDSALRLVGELPSLTSASAQHRYLPGDLIHLGGGPAWKDLQVEIYHRNSTEPRMLVPAVAEPQIIWNISGNLLLEDRYPGGEWSTFRAAPGDVFLTTSPTPYELRWRALDSDPPIAMHVLIGIPFLARAAKDLFGPNAQFPLLKEVYSARDTTLTNLLELLRVELVERSSASEAFVQGVAQSLAVHLVRNYGDHSRKAPTPSNKLPPFRLRRVEMMMAESMETGIQIGEIAAAIEMSESHFSRLFKATTGMSPSQYFIRMRMDKAQRLLRETRREIIDIALEVGYSSASHFGQVFRKEAGMTPQDYRHADLHARPRRN